MSENKFRVTMTNAFAMDDGSIRTERAQDYVPESILESYVADRRTVWQSVAVSTEPDWGPGGPDGETNIPTGLGGN